MKALIFILIIVGSIYQTTAQSDCTCPYKFQNTIGIFKNGIICGYQNKDDIDTLYYAISIQDCKNEKLIFENSNDEISPYKFKKYKNGIGLISCLFAPVGDEWKMQVLPATENIYEWQGNKLKLSQSRIIFKYPQTELSKKQISDIKSLLIHITESKQSTKTFYPGDEKSLYILSIGVLFNIGESRKTFEELETHFNFDGSIAETKREIFYNILSKK